MHTTSSPNHIHLPQKPSSSQSPSSSKIMKSTARTTISSSGILTPISSPTLPIRDDIIILPHQHTNKNYENNKSNSHANNNNNDNTNAINHDIPISVVPSSPSSNSTITKSSDTVIDFDAITSSNHSDTKPTDDESKDITLISNNINDEKNSLENKKKKTNIRQHITQPTAINTNTNNSSSNDDDHIAALDNKTFYYDKYIEKLNFASTSLYLLDYNDINNTLDFTTPSSLSSLSSSSTTPASTLKKNNEHKENSLHHHRHNSTSTIGNTNNTNNTYSPCQMKMSGTINRACLGIVHSVQRHQSAGPFLFPFKPKDWDIPEGTDCSLLLKETIDLQTIQNKLESNEYDHPFHFFSDIKIMLHNVQMFWKQNDNMRLFNMATNLEKYMASLITKLSKKQKILIGVFTDLEPCQHQLDLLLLATLEESNFSAPLLLNNNNQKQQHGCGCLPPLSYSYSSSSHLNHSTHPDTPSSSTTTAKSNVPNSVRVSRRIAQKKVLPALSSPPHTSASADDTEEEVDVITSSLAKPTRRISTIMNNTSINTAGATSASQDDIEGDHPALSGSVDGIPSPVSTISEVQPITPISSPTLPQILPDNDKPIVDTHPPSTISKPEDKQVELDKASSKSNTKPVATKQSHKKLYGNSHSGRICAFCGVRSTPMWRHGPPSFDPLCNSCGVKWRRGRILSEFKHSTMVSPVKKKAPSLPSKNKNNHGGNNTTDKENQLGDISNINNSNNQNNNKNRSNMDSKKITTAPESGGAILNLLSKQMTTRSRTHSAVQENEYSESQSSNLKPSPYIVKIRKRKQSAIFNAHKDLKKEDNTEKIDVEDQINHAEESEKKKRKLSNSAINNHEDLANSTTRTSTTKFIHPSQLTTAAASDTLPRNSPTLQSSSPRPKQMNGNQDKKQLTKLDTMKYNIKMKNKPEGHHKTGHNVFPGPLYSMHYDMLDMDSDEEDPDPVFHQPMNAFKNNQVIEKTMLFSQTVKHMPIDKLIDVVSILKDHVSSDFFNALTTMKQDIEVDSSLLDDQTWSKLCSLI